MALEIVHNPEARRFEVAVDGHLAVLEYIRGDRRLALVHTLVPEALGGQGIGGQLARAGLEYARREGLAVDPVCPFVARYLEKHPEYHELLEPAAGRL